MLPCEKPCKLKEQPIWLLSLYETIGGYSKFTTIIPKLILTIE